MPRVVLVALITASLLSMPAALTTYRERGILCRMRTTPARPADLLVAQLVLHPAAAFLGAALAVAAGRLVRGVALPERIFSYGLTLLPAILAGPATGAVISTLARTVKAAQAIGPATFFPAMFAAGIYVPLPVLPDAVRRVVELIPFGAAAQALSRAAEGASPGWIRLGVQTLWTVILATVAARWFRWE